MLCLVRGGWPFKEITCVFLGYVTIMCVSTSGLTINCIAVCRYVTVAYPNPVRRKLIHGRVVIAASTSLIAVAVVAVLLPIFGIGDVGFNETLGHCSLKYDNQYEWWYGAMLILMGFMATLTIVPVSYGLIFWIVRNSRRSVESTSMASRTRPSSGVEHSTKQNNRSHNSSKANHPRRNITRAELRLSKKLLTLFAVFILCWIPYTAVVLADKYSTVPRQVQRATNFLIWINPCLNPFLYAWMIQTYRQAYKRIFSYLLCRKQSCFL
eukprot:XP_011664263.1 PREDICTED: G-protein coupled receptor moody-like [Strongylocentrotus purpuratus]